MAQQLRQAAWDTHIPYPGTWVQEPAPHPIPEVEIPAPHPIPEVEIPFLPKAPWRQQLTAHVLGFSLPRGRPGLNSCFLALAWPNPSCCGHFGIESVNGRALHLSIK